MAHLIESKELRQCIDICMECADSCDRTATHCLSMGGEHASQEHQTLLHDCADICLTAARFMSRGSHQHPRTCAVCAEICRLCADDCERLANGDRMMQQCAEFCRRCAESCEKMAEANV